MRLCFEKKKLWLFLVSCKIRVPSSPAIGQRRGAIGQRRRGGGAAAAAGADRDTSVLRPLYVKYIGLKNGFYLNYHNQFKIKYLWLYSYIINKFYIQSTYILQHPSIFFSAHMAVIVLETYI